MQYGQCLEEVRQKFFERLSSDPCGSLAERPQSRPLQILHRQVDPASRINPRVQDPDDSRVRDALQGINLSLELEERAFVEYLQRDHSIVRCPDGSVHTSKAACNYSGPCRVGDPGNRRLRALCGLTA